VAGICFNEDQNHFYYSRRNMEVGPEEAEALLRQYGGTQINDFLINVNAMKTGYASSVWEPFWHGYDPEAGEEQPLFRSISGAMRTTIKSWIHRAWQMNRDGIDPYAIWLQAARKLGMTAWVSVRMNDIHFVDDPLNPLCSDFWREHPEYRRISHRFADWNDHAYDYGRQEVREYHMRLIEEVLSRYDMDGLELDWMRFGYHIKPGEEAEGRRHLNAFVGEVRRLLDEKERQTGKRIRLACRVASRPQTAYELGTDAVHWARQGWIDMLAIAPFFNTIETDMPIELWRQLLEGTNVTLAAGIELHARPYPTAPIRLNSPEVTRGAAFSLLSRGADRIYLFNYFDEIDEDGRQINRYLPLMNELGELETMRGLARRHLLTYADVASPGEPRNIMLPLQLKAGRHAEVRVHIGERPGPAQSVFFAAIGGAGERLDRVRVHVNGAVCGPAEPAALAPPHVAGDAYRFAIPHEALGSEGGYQIIDLTLEDGAEDVSVHWLEISIGAAGEDRR